MPLWWQSIPSNINAPSVKSTWLCKTHCLSTAYSLSRILVTTPTALQDHRETISVSTRVLWPKLSKLFRGPPVVSNNLPVAASRHWPTSTYSTLVWVPTVHGVTLFWRGNNPTLLTKRVKNEYAHAYWRHYLADICLSVQVVISLLLKHL